MFEKTDNISKQGGKKQMNYATFLTVKTNYAIDQSYPELNIKNEREKPHLSPNMNLQHSLLDTRRKLNI